MIALLLTLALAVIAGVIAGVLRGDAKRMLFKRAHAQLSRALRLLPPSEAAIREEEWTRHLQDLEEEEAPGHALTYSFRLVLDARRLAKELASAETGRWRRRLGPNPRTLIASLRRWIEGRDPERQMRALIIFMFTTTTIGLIAFVVRAIVGPSPSLMTTISTILPAFGTFWFGRRVLSRSRSRSRL